MAGTKIFVTKKNIIAAMVASVVLIGGFSSSTFGQWKLTAPNLLGPIFQNNGAMTFNSGVLWAATDHVWRSNDSGSDWIETPLSFSGNACQISFIDSHNGLVTTHQGEVFLTRDGGKSWKNIHNVGSACSGILLDSNDILVCKKEPGGVDYSWDGGKTWNTSYGDSWDHDLIAGPKPGTSFMLSANYNTLMHVWSSTDTGASWSMLPGLLDIDEWSMAFDPCNPELMYAINEGYTHTADYTGRSKIFVSSDGGVTWNVTANHPAKYFAGSLSLGPHTIFVPTVSEVDAGIFRSTDHGQTWQHVGGPSSSADTRLIVAINDNLVIASDINGGIWVTFNSGGDSITLPQSSSSLLLASSHTHVMESSCNPTDTSVPLMVSECGPFFASLDSAWLSGSLAFALADTRAVPRTLAAVDSILISYAGTGGADTAYLHLRYDLGSGARDTAVLLTGTLSPLAAESQRLHREAASAYYGQIDSLLMAVDLNANVNIDSLWPYIGDIQATFAFDSSVVQFDAYIPAAGWRTKSVTNNGNSVDIVITKISGNPSQPLDLGTALFDPNSAQLATSWVTLPRFIVDAGGQSLSLCVTENEDSHWAVKSLGAQSGVAGTPVATTRDEISIYPNPAENELFVRNTNAHLALISIYDAIGRSVASASARAASTTPIDIQSLPRGSYIVVAQMGDRIVTMRLSKTQW